MKKGKSILLLLGIIPVVVRLLIYAHSFVYILSQGSSVFNLARTIFAVLFCLLILIFVIILLLMNLKNRSNKGIAIISLIVCSLGLLAEILWIIMDIPRYQILGYLGHTMIIMAYITEIISDIIGYSLLIVGSALSVRKKEQPATTDSVNL